MVDEKTLVKPPEIPDMDLSRFNVLFAHLFSVLSHSQSMATFQINPCKHNTVHDLVNSTFPAIKATDNKPTPAVTPKTVGYIHALVIDVVTFHSTEAPYARALRNQDIVCGELDKLTLLLFKQNSAIAWWITTRTSV